MPTKAARGSSCEQRKENMSNDRTLSLSTVIATIRAPVEQVNIADWLFHLPDAEYQRCSEAHIAAGATTTDDGRPMSINVETIGDALVVQHYVAETHEPRFCRMVSISDSISPAGHTKLQVVWELSVKKIDEQTCEYTNHIHSTAIDQTLGFLKSHNIPFETARDARQRASHAHNQEETPKFAKSIERRALLASDLNGGKAMKVLFIISSSETAFWLSEVTHPYWHLTERGVQVDFASPQGGKVVFDHYSDPYFEKSLEPDDLVSKGFLSDKKSAAKLETTLKLKDVDLSQYDAIHVAGGRGATFDLFPNEDVGKALEYFWARDKVVGAICHGAIALGNIPDRIRGRQVTGFTLEADRQLQATFGSDFIIPNYPQTVLEKTGAIYTSTKPYTPKVVIDGKLITGQDQSAASEYALALLHKMTGQSPVSSS
jgi:putative intracellular protease/amidase